NYIVAFTIAEGDAIARRFSAGAGIVEKRGVALVAKPASARQHLLACAAEAVQKYNGPVAILGGHKPAGEGMLIARCDGDRLDGIGKIARRRAHDARPGTRQAVRRDPGKAGE